jgi:hypothetical protein
MGINRGFHFSKFGKASSAIYKYNHHTVPAIYHSLLLSPFPHFSQFGVAPTKFYHLWNFIQQNMESTVWSKLPGNVQILILEKLPLLDLGSMSLTCKYFNSLLSDPSFAIYYDQHPTIFVSFSGHPTLSVSFPLDERMTTAGFQLRCLAGKKAFHAHVAKPV